MAETEQEKEPDLEGDSPAPDPPLEAPKIVLKDKHALHDPNAKRKRMAKVTLNHRTAGGHMVQLRKGKECMVPALAVEDMERSGLIHRKRG